MGGRRMSTTIRVSRETKNRLQSIGRKDESYDDIINQLYHERNILAIHEVCKDMDDFTTSTIYQVFDCIGYVMPPAPETLNMKGENWYTGNDYNEAQRLYRNHIFEMAEDEDLIGSFREPPVSEIITNIYCLFEDIPAPTWSMSLRFKNPFARFNGE